MPFNLYLYAVCTFQDITKEYHKRLKAKMCPSSFLCLKNVNQAGRPYKCKPTEILEHPLVKTAKAPFYKNLLG